MPKPVDKAVTAEKDDENESDEPKAAASSVEELDELKKLTALRTELNECFVKLDRMFAIIQEKEETFDFPVSFVTNILYVCEKNGQRHLLSDPLAFGQEEPENKRRL